MKKLFQVIIMLYAVINAINRCIFLAMIYLDIMDNFRKTAHLGIVRIA